MHCHLDTHLWCTFRMHHSIVHFILCPQSQMISKIVFYLCMKQFGYKISVIFDFMYLLILIAFTFKYELHKFEFETLFKH